MDSTGARGCMNRARSGKVLFIVNGKLDSYTAYNRNFRRFIAVALENNMSPTVVGFIGSQLPSHSHLHSCRLVLDKKTKAGRVRLFWKTIVELARGKYETIVLGSVCTPLLVLYVRLMRVFKPNNLVYYMQDPVPESAAMLYHDKPALLRGILHWAEVYAERSICSACTHLVAPSEMLLRIVSSRVNMATCVTILAYNTSNVSNLELYLGQLHGAQVKRTPPKEPVFLYSGKIQKKIRGLEQQLEVFRRILLKWPAARFVIAGAGDIAYFMRFAQALGVAENVQFVGTLSKMGMAELYSTSDIIIFPPIRYLLPSKFFDALYAGVLPIVYEQSEEMSYILGEARVSYDGTNEDLYKVLRQTIPRLTSLREAVKKLRPAVLGIDRATCTALASIFHVAGIQEHGRSYSDDYQSIWN